MSQFKWQYSIFAKIMIASILCLSITPMLIFAFVSTRVRSNLLEERSAESVRLLNNQASEIELLLDDVLANLHFLSRLPLVAAYVDNPSDDNRAEVEAVFAIFAEAEAIYDQIRLLSPEGMEVVRVNYNDQQVEIVPQANLQDKSNRNYFQAAQGLVAGELYISELNLNQEDGIIEEPYTPALRYAMPIFNEDGELGAILILNLLPDKIFNIASQLHPNATYYVANSMGDIMYSNVENAADILYATDLGHDSNLRNIFPKIDSNASQASVIIDEIQDCFISYIPIVIDDGIQERRWFLVREQTLNSITAPINETIMSITVIGVFGLLVSVFVSVLIARNITRPLQSLVSASKNLRERNWQSSFELTRVAKSKDEIGVLAQSLEDTLHELRNFYLQLEALVKDRTLELEWANEQLKQVDALKTRFMEDIAHDIRTPLASILLNTSLVQRKPDATERYITRIEQQVQRIQSLMENVNMMSKVELSFDNVDNLELILLLDLVEPIIEAHRSTIEEVGLSLRLDIKAVPSIRGQRFMLEQLFENLFTNAIKYTHAGSISVSLYQANHHIVLNVKDTGIGIPETDMPMIGRRYYRAQNVKQSSTPGTGIGLSIVKDAAKFHGGEMHIQSKVNKGTEVTVILPTKRNTNGSSNKS